MGRERPYRRGSSDRIRSGGGVGSLDDGGPLYPRSLVHLQVIATGAPIFPAFEANHRLRLFALRCGAVCAAYVLAWALTRSQRQDRLAGQAL
jgi:hypothetical protein